jgi:hypothetical protein
MKIYNFLNKVNVEHFGKVPNNYWYLFEQLNGDDGFWGGDVAHMLFGLHFEDWRLEDLHEFPGITPWRRGITFPEDAGIYIQGYPFKVTTYWDVYPRLVLTALQEHVDQLSAQQFLTGILDYELEPATTAGVWIGKKVVAELMGRRDEANPTMLVITYTDGYGGVADGQE